MAKKLELKFSLWLKAFRCRHRLTQMQVAEVLRISLPRVSEWEREVRTPKPLTQLGIKQRLADTENWK